MIVRFQDYEFDFTLKQLSQSGRLMKLDYKAAELLALLLENPGRLVTREEIRKRLWQDGTYVDFENRINVYLNQIRAVLGDDPQHPRFIRTKKTRGYEFIAALSRAPEEEGTALAFAPPGHGVAETPKPPVQVVANERPSLMGHAPRMVMGTVLLVLATLTLKAMMAGAYWQAIGALSLFVIYMVVLSAQLEMKSALSRTAVATLVIGAMAYTASASTMPYVISTVVNASTLKPALTYPLITGLKFIPLYVLVFGFWVFFALTNDRGFPHSTTARRAYIASGIAFLGATAVALGGLSGDFRIWHAELPGYRTFVLGYSAILLLNVSVWAAGYWCFRQEAISHYRRLFVFCGLVYLPLTTVAALVDQQYNELNRYYLDQRRPVVYLAENPEIVREIAANIPSAWKDEVGEDLAGLLKDPRFLTALEKQHFYKQNFDEPFQMGTQAVMFGYKANPAAPAGASPFRIVRFPLKLAEAIRFRANGPAEAPVPGAGRHGSLSLVPLALCGIAVIIAGTLRRQQFSFIGRSLRVDSTSLGRLIVGLLERRLLFTNKV
jgi:DNA-binding winged helix-turn-helix (wHTH) protein